MIIPCYNESKNIPSLFDEIAENQKKFEFEIIIVNNGSTDNSNLIIEENRYKLKNFKLITIKKNVGFGNGVKAGLLKSDSNLVCYTHGDLQINISNCLYAFKIFNNSKSEIFVKSKRQNRSIMAFFFTILMGLFNSLIFRMFLYDIHSQPNFFIKPEKKIIFSCPDDMGIDLYFYVFFKKKNYKIERFNVSFKKRLHGIGNNEYLIHKLRYSLKSLKNSFQVKKKLNENI